MTAVVHWRKGDADGVLAAAAPFRGDPFAVIDPGSTGMAAVFAPTDQWVEPRPPLMTEPIFGWDGAVTFAGRALARDVRTLIVEQTYVRMDNPNSSLDLARQAAWCAGVFKGLAIAHRKDVLVVWVTPTSWANPILIPHVRAQTPPGKVPKKRKERQAMLVEIAGKTMAADSRWRAANKVEREALAAVLGIATWWAKLDTKAPRAQCDLF